MLCVLYTIYTFDCIQCSIEKSNAFAYPQSGSTNKWTLNYWIQCIGIFMSVRISFTDSTFFFSQRINSLGFLSEKFRSIDFVMWKDFGVPFFLTFNVRIKCYMSVPAYVLRIYGVRGSRHTTSNLVFLSWKMCVNTLSLTHHFSNVVPANWLRSRSAQYNTTQTNPIREQTMSQRLDALRINIGSCTSYIFVLFSHRL